MDSKEAIIEESAPKKTTARRRTAATKTTSDDTSILHSQSTNHIPVNSFANLINQISQAQQEFYKLQKEIEETQNKWLKEQKDHETEMIARNTGEELERKRNQENYDYDQARKRKLTEDEFNDKKAAWEKQLRDSQDQITKEKQELEDLRKLAENFETEKEKAVKEAQMILEKELTQKFEVENQLKDQEFKSEKELLNLRITNLQSENSRQKTEIETLKKSFDEATHQVKDIAVKVIESGNSTPRATSTES